MYLKLERRVKEVPKNQRKIKKENELESKCEMRGNDISEMDGTKLYPSRLRRLRPDLN